MSNRVVNGHTEADAEKDDCSLCLETLLTDESHVAQCRPCRHVYHRCCLEESVRYSQHCPICRTRIKSFITLDKFELLPLGEPVKVAEREYKGFSSVCDMGETHMGVNCVNNCLLRSGCAAYVEADDYIVECCGPKCGRWCHGICVGFPTDKADAPPAGWECPRCRHKASMSHADMLITAGVRQDIAEKARAGGWAGMAAVNAHFFPALGTVDAVQKLAAQRSALLQGPSKIDAAGTGDAVARSMTGRSSAGGSSAASGSAVGAECETAEKPPRRGRGRPRKDQSLAADSVRPATASDYRGSSSHSAGGGGGADGGRASSSSSSASSRCAVGGAGAGSAATALACFDDDESIGLLLKRTAALPPVTPAPAPTAGCRDKDAAASAGYRDKDAAGSAAVSLLRRESPLKLASTGAVAAGDDGGTGTRLPSGAALSVQLGLAPGPHTPEEALWREAADAEMAAFIAANVDMGDTHAAAHLRAPHSSLRPVPPPMKPGVKNCRSLTRRHMWQSWDESRLPPPQIAIPGPARQLYDASRLFQGVCQVCGQVEAGGLLCVPDVTASTYAGVSSATAHAPASYLLTCSAAGCRTTVHPACYGAMVSSKVCGSSTGSGSSSGSSGSSGSMGAGVAASAGSTFAGSEGWLCKPCGAGFAPPHAPPCALCPCTGGPMARTNDGRWAHNYCIYWRPNAFYEDEVAQDIAEAKVEGYHMALYNGLLLERSESHRRCELCCTHSGATIACSAEGCTAAFHPMCAALCGSYLHVERGWTQRCEPDGSFIAYCTDHTAIKRDQEANTAARVDATLCGLPPGKAPDTVELLSSACADPRDDHDVPGVSAGTASPSQAAQAASLSMRARGGSFATAVNATGRAASAGGRDVASTLTDDARGSHRSNDLRKGDKLQIFWPLGLSSPAAQATQRRLLAGAPNSGGRARDKGSRRKAVASAAMAPSPAPSSSSEAALCGSAQDASFGLLPHSSPETEARSQSQWMPARVLRVISQEQLIAVRYKGSGIVEWLHVAPSALPWWIRQFGGGGTAVSLAAYSAEGGSGSASSGGSGSGSANSSGSGNDSGSAPRCSGGAGSAAERPTAQAAPAHPKAQQFRDPPGSQGGTFSAAAAAGLREADRHRERLYHKRDVRPRAGSMITMASPAPPQARATSGRTAQQTVADEVLTSKTSSIRMDTDDALPSSSQAKALAAAPPPPAESTAGMCAATIGRAAAGLSAHLSAAGRGEPAVEVAGPSSSDVALFEALQAASESPTGRAAIKAGMEAFRAYQRAKAARLLPQPQASSGSTRHGMDSATVQNTGSASLATRHPPLAGSSAARGTTSDGAAQAVASRQSQQCMQEDDDDDVDFVDLSNVSSQPVAELQQAKAHGVVGAGAPKLTATGAGAGAPELTATGAGIGRSATASEAAIRTQQHLASSSTSAHQLQDVRSKLHAGDESGDDDDIVWISSTLPLPPPSLPRTATRLSPSLKRLQSSRSIAAAERRLASAAESAGAPTVPAIRPQAGTSAGGLQTCSDGRLASFPVHLSQIESAAQMRRDTTVAAICAVPSAPAVDTAAASAPPAERDTDVGTKAVAPHSGVRESITKPAEQPVAQQAPGVPQTAAAGSAAGNRLGDAPSVAASSDLVLRMPLDTLPSLTGHISGAAEERLASSLDKVPDAIIVVLKPSPKSTPLPMRASGGMQQQQQQSDSTESSAAAAANSSGGRDAVAAVVSALSPLAAVRRVSFLRYQEPVTVALADGTAHHASKLPPGKGAAAPPVQLHVRAPDTNGRQATEIQEYWLAELARRSSQLRAPATPQAGILVHPSKTDLAAELRHAAVGKPVAVNDGRAVPVVASSHSSAVAAADNLHDVKAGNAVNAANAMGTAALPHVAAHVSKGVTSERELDADGPTQVGGKRRRMSLDLSASPSSSHPLPRLEEQVALGAAATSNRLDEHLARRATAAERCTDATSTGRSADAVVHAVDLARKSGGVAQTTSGDAGNKQTGAFRATGFAPRRESSNAAACSCDDMAAPPMDVLRLSGAALKADLKRRLAEHTANLERGSGVRSSTGDVGAFAFRHPAAVSSPADDGGAKRSPPAAKRPRTDARQSPSLPQLVMDGLKPSATVFSAGQIPQPWSLSPHSEAAAPGTLSPSGGASSARPSVAGSDPRRPRLQLISSPGSLAGGVGYIAASLKSHLASASADSGAAALPAGLQDASKPVEVHFASLNDPPSPLLRPQ